MTDNENISDNIFNFLFMAMGQVNELKNKIDPEVKDLLLQSATDAISSAKNFLDALDTVVGQLKSSGDEETVLNLNETHENVDPILKLRDSKAQ